MPLAAFGERAVLEAGAALIPPEATGVTVWPASSELPTPAEVADRSFLDRTHPIYQRKAAAWAREEARGQGGDEAKAYLWRFENESDASYRDRLNAAKWVGFGMQHARQVTGHLAAKAPVPGKGLSYGTEMGDVRSRDKIDSPTYSELIEYNADGIGSDGMSRQVLFDAIDILAQQIGHMWVMVEHATLADLAAIRAVRGQRPVLDPTGQLTLASFGTITDQDRIDGYRAYVVAWSPLKVWDWRVTKGRLDYAIVHTPVGDETEDGYYLLVRAGFTGFGPTYARGGWWQFTADKTPHAQGTWADTRGQIPMWIHYGERSAGTTVRPDLSRSSTYELDQISTSLMNIASAWVFDAWDGASGLLHASPATPEVMTEVNTQITTGNRFIGWPMVEGSDGKQYPVSLSDASAGVVTAGVFKELVTAHYDEADAIMMRKLSSTPDASGASKDAGFREGSSPFLATRAAYREASDNTFLYFAALRMGKRADGASTWPRDFDLQSKAEGAADMLDVLLRSGLTSRTLAKACVMAKGDEEGWITDENRDDVDTELDEEPAPAVPPGSDGTSPNGASSGNGGNANGAPGAVPPALRKFTVAGPDGTPLRTITES